VEGLVQELVKEKVKIYYSTEIKGFSEKNGKLVSFTDQNGKTWKSDIFVINADAAWFRGKIFNRKKYTEQKLDKMNWTMGYLTFYLGIKCKLPQVNHHNYYLGANFEEYAHNVLKNPDTLQKPYYYVNVLSKHNSECAPEGYESLFFVCPVPNLQVKPNWADKDEIVNSIIDDFSKRIKKDIRPEIVSKTIYTPEDWQNQFNLHRGSGLGLSHSMKQIGALRPANFDEKFKNVFYVGASTVPGAGLPMAIISSKLAFERIVTLQDAR
jgi:phytoene desaturase